MSEQSYGLQGNFWNRIIVQNVFGNKIRIKLISPNLAQVLVRRKLKTFFKDVHVRNCSFRVVRPYFFSRPEATDLQVPNSKIGAIQLNNGKQDIEKVIVMSLLSVFIYKCQSFIFKKKCKSYPSFIFGRKKSKYSVFSSFEWAILITES